MYGVQPRMPINQKIMVKMDAPTAKKFITEMQEALHRARENILKAQEAQKCQSDKHRQSHKFKEGDLVLLNNKNLRTPDESAKLRLRFIGPFRIVKQMSPDNFKLDLPDNLRIHNNFHVNLLKPYIPNDSALFPNQTVSPPEPIQMIGHVEYEVERIIDIRRRHRRTQYLIKWKGYSEHESTWEDEEDCQNARKMIEKFLQNRNRQDADRKSNRKTHQVFSIKASAFVGMTKYLNWGRNSQESTKSSQHTKIKIDYTQKTSQDNMTQFRPNPIKIRASITMTYVDCINETGIYGYQSKRTEDHGEVFYYTMGNIIVFYISHPEMCNCSYCNTIKEAETEEPLFV